MLDQIWLAQIVVYPLFAMIGEADCVAHHRLFARRIPLPVRSRVASFVLPRSACLPDGLTVLTGSGQFRSANANIVVEGAKLLMLPVPRRDGEADR